MATIYPDQGIDLQFAVFPKNGTNYATLYLFLFTSQTSTTVPARTATGGSSPSGWTEVSGSGYGRIAVLSSDWGSPATSGVGRILTASQKTFTSAGSWTVANGYGLATQSASGSSDKVLYFSNFNSGLARTLVGIDQLHLTPALLLTQA